VIDAFVKIIKEVLSGIISYKLTATIIEIFHSLVDGVYNNPVKADCLFTLIANTFDLSSAYIVDIIGIIWHPNYILPFHRIIAKMHPKTNTNCCRADSIEEERML
jgi:hypothetical protein